MRRLLLASAVGAAALFAWPRGADALVCGNCEEEVGAIVRQIESMAKWAQQLAHNVKQEVHNNAELMQLLETYRETVKVYNQAVTTYNALTGVRDLGSAAYAMETVGIQNPFPAEAYDVQALMRGTGSISGHVGSLFGTNLSANRVYDTRGLFWRGDEMADNANSIAGLQAMSEQAYRANSDRLSKMSELRARMRTASDPKEAQDLQLAVAAMQADAAAQQMQLQGAHLMFTASQASRAQRSDENETRCLRIVVAYFGGSGGGALNCPEMSSGTAGVVAAAYGAGFNGSSSAAPSASGGASLDTMLSRSWGETAADNARSLGVDPRALAATCVVESNCDAAAQASTSSAGGAFQFINGTWQEQAGRVGVSTDLSAKYDPAASSLAAANYLKEGGQKLQSYGIDDPTFGQVRAIYQFGGAGVNVATAPDDAVFSSVIPSASSATLRNNGITAGVTTVGQWRNSVRAKVGADFDAPIFARSNT